MQSAIKKCEGMKTRNILGFSFPNHKNQAENNKFKIYKFLKTYIKMEKNIKFGDIEIEKQKFHQHKEPISMKNIDSNKITVSNRSLSVKKDLCISLATKTLKKLDLYAYFSKKWHHIENTLMKLCFFFDKRWWIIRKVQW